MNKATSRLWLLLLTGACLLCLAPRSTAQKPIDQMPASARQLISVKVTGTQRYPEDAVIAASGLQLGTAVNDDDFKKAARRLGEIGVFGDISYNYSYSSAGTKLVLQISDAQKFVPVRFEDFVWFSDEELLRRIKERAPLFNGELPLSGKLADQVSDVLQALLVENAIPGHVDYLRSGKTDAPVDSIVYEVSDVLIQIRNVEFTGASDAELPALKSAAQRVFDREYSRSVLGALVQHQLLPVYYARGYLKAAFSDPQPKVVKKPSSENEDGPRNLTIVDVNFAVTPGQRYKLQGMQWSGNHEFSTDVLQKMVRAQVGEPANTVRIADNLKDIQKLYGSRGYVTAAIKADAEFDDAAGTALIHFDVKEGFEYHMGELEFRGLDNSLTAKLRNIWKIRPGDVYDATYLSEYLVAAHKLLPSGLDWDVAPHVTANLREKTVDVDLIYSVKAPK
ncbi:MAG TPA: POTRA domain-containing protein [Candidatus Dormibacteraeota bacterium]|nr:POTRA domain-containing protein [Candidatus Dormibacteraeota bacterium]